MKLNKISLRFAAMIASSILVSGCFPEPRMPLSMYPADLGPEGYSRDNSTGIFDNGKIRISVKRLGKGESGAELVDELIEKDFIVLRMEMVNSSASKVMYNPSFTTFTNNEMDYLKPIDFTDLYDISDRVENGERKFEVPGARLMALQGKLFDTTLTIQPGQTVSRLLLFKPFSEGVKTAGLFINDIYVGTDTIDAYFPFVFKPKETAAPKPL